MGFSGRVPHPQPGNIITPEGEDSRMPELNAPADELAAYLDSNVPWSDVAEMYGYRSGREARHAALQARDELTNSTETPA